MHNENDFCSLSLAQIALLWSTRLTKALFCPLRSLATGNKEFNRAQVSFVRSFVRFGSTATTKATPKLKAIAFSLLVNFVLMCERQSLSDATDGTSQNEQILGTR